MGKRGRHVQVERALARDTPDELEQIFDLERPSFRNELNQWTRSFQKLMRIKHGSNVEVDMTHTGVPGLPSVKAVKIFVKK